MCSQKRALCVTGVVLGCLLGIALIIAFAGTASGKLTQILLKLVHIFSLYCLLTLNIF